MLRNVSRGKIVRKVALSSAMLAPLRKLRSFGFFLMLNALIKTTFTDFLRANTPAVLVASFWTTRSCDFPALPCICLRSTVSECGSLAVSGRTIYSLHFRKRAHRSVSNAEIHP